MEQLTDSTRQELGADSPYLPQTISAKQTEEFLQSSRTTPRSEYEQISLRARVLDWAGDHKGAVATITITGSAVTVLAAWKAYSALKRRHNEEV